MSGALHVLLSAPHVGVSWRTEAGFLLLVEDALRVMPAVDRHGVGIYNQTSAAIGYAWRLADSASVRLSLFTMPSNT